MTTAPDQQPSQVPQPGMPPIIINNNVAASSSASATAIAGGFGSRRRRQSFWVHFWLFMFTMGIGNVVYAMSVSRWNRDRGL
ncbi:hypothetical protein OHT61_31905 [Streptomyces sp. NBC_00178]|uniref:hypothetical protein n=1 Tax=Streptomyces sp. NBC_00178 TaxID=2975672 RepID=UPI002E2BF4B6|nr:hypothetical protein [Streptomyces sp. NBC_00178]